ncbi:MAG: hypothetical protein ACRC5H_03425 [Treponemataceae bacterium]
MVDEVFKVLTIFILSSTIMRLLSIIHVRGIASFRLYVVYSIVYVCSLILFAFVFTFSAVGTNRIAFYCVCIFLGLSYFIFLYFYSQTSVRIFKQLDLPWTALFIISPLTATIFCSFSNSEKIHGVINDYEESIVYKKYIEKLQKSVKCTFINWFYTELIIDNFSFMIINDNNNFHLSCDKKKFEKKFERAYYFLGNFSQSEKNLFKKKNHISFLLSQKQLLQMCKDFSAILIKADKLMFKNIPLFIRNEDFSYGVIYSRRHNIDFSFIESKKMSSIYYNHIVVDQANLMKLFEKAIHQ